ncbi:hypothetical protein [Kitasatospora sp. NPDC050543]|uniref:hypothetical protein n=1 Tax=Kitasatospora sp. NPDC050543 TaxID=3364054 RepID=UPI0037B1DA32
MDIPTLRDAKPDTLETAADAYRQLDDALLNRQQDWRAGTAEPIRTSSWTGEASVAANKSIDHTDERLANAITDLAPMADALRNGAYRIRTAQRDLLNTLEEAKSKGLIVGDDGSVTWTPPAPGRLGDDPEASKRMDDQNRARAEDTSAEIQMILQRADDADRDLATQLNAFQNAATELTAQSAPA